MSITLTPEPVIYTGTKKLTDVDLSGLDHVAAKVLEAFTQDVNDKRHFASFSTSTDEATKRMARWLGLPLTKLPAYQRRALEQRVGAICRAYNAEVFTTVTADQMKATVQGSTTVRGYEFNSATKKMDLVETINP